MPLYTNNPDLLSASTYISNIFHCTTIAEYRLVKSFLPILLLIILIFSAAPAYGQGEDSPITPTQLSQMDIRFEYLTTESLVPLSNSNSVGNLLGAQGAAVPADILILTNEQGEYPLGLHLEILEDEDKFWTIDDVSSSELAQQFVPSQETAPNLGFSDSAFWIRFRVRNETEETTDWQLAIQRTTNLFFTDVYVPAPDQQSFMVTKTGTYLPFQTRDVKVTQYVFNVPLLPGAEQTIHMRIQSEGLISIPLTLWSSEALAQRHRVELVLLGIFYGVLLITIGYNTFVYLFLRDISYLYYVLFIACFLLQILSGDGVAQQYLWPNAVGWNAYSTPLFYILGVAFALKFASSFLLTKVNVPKLHKLINVLFIICVVAAISLPFGGLNYLNVALFILIMVSNITMIVVGLIIWRQGYRPARYYLAAWSLFFVTSILISIMGIDFLPNNLVTSQSYRFGLMTLVLLLSIALADRINTLRREREETQAELIRKQHEALELREAQATAVAEERNRLARDLHDSVTQSLYSASLLAEVLPGMWRRDPDEAENGLGELRHLTRGALAEMRTMLLELRPETLLKSPLGDLLEQLVEALTSRMEIETQLDIQPVPVLPPDVHINFYRVAQEALNNVIKHSKASQLRISLLSLPQFSPTSGDGWRGQIELCIQDDGKGFNLGEIQLTSLGLGIMHERSAEIKAAFSIESQPDQETVVTLVWEQG